MRREPKVRVTKSAWPPLRLTVGRTERRAARRVGHHPLARLRCRRHACTSCVTSACCRAVTLCAPTSPRLPRPSRDVHRCRSLQPLLLRPHRALLRRAADSSDPSGAERNRAIPAPRGKRGIVIRGTRSPKPSGRHSRSDSTSQRRARRELDGRRDDGALAVCPDQARLAFTLAFKTWRQERVMNGNLAHRTSDPKPRRARRCQEQAAHGPPEWRGGSGRCVRGGPPRGTSPRRSCRGEAPRSSRRAGWRGSGPCLSRA